MNRTILYYPTINIPGKSWLSNAVLYWDEVCSIVPQSYDDTILSQLSPDIHYLMSEGEFRPIKPETLIFQQNGWDSFQQLQQEFQEIVASPAFQSFLVIKHSIPQKKEYRWSEIHANKTSDGIFDFLEERGLAKQTDSRAHDQKWLLFESNTALLYMSLLAKYLADADGEQTVVGTDRGNYEKFNFKPTSKNTGFPVLSLDFNRVLPTPRPDLPLKKIVAFKRRRADNLRHFKKTISDFQTKIGNAKSEAELKETAINFEEVLVNGVTDLRHALKDAKIESGFKTLKSLISIKSPTTLVTAATLANSKYSIINLPLSWAALGIAAVGALELTCQYIDTNNKIRAKLRESPFSYVYRADELGFFNKRV